MNADSTGIWYKQSGWLTLDPNRISEWLHQYAIEIADGTLPERSILGPRPDPFLLERASIQLAEDQEDQEGLEEILEELDEWDVDGATQKIHELYRRPDIPHLENYKYCDNHEIAFHRGRECPLCDVEKEKKKTNADLLWTLLLHHPKWEFRVGMRVFVLGQDWMDIGSVRSQHQILYEHGVDLIDLASRKQVIALFTELYPNFSWEDHETIQHMVDIVVGGWNTSHKPFLLAKDVLRARK